MHAHILAGAVVASLDIWIAINVMVVLALLAPSRKAARFSSLPVFCARNVNIDRARIAFRVVPNCRNRGADRGRPNGGCVA